MGVVNDGQGDASLLSDHQDLLQTPTLRVCAWTAQDEMSLARPMVKPVVLPRFMTMKHGSSFWSKMAGQRISSSGTIPWTLKRWLVGYFIRHHTWEECIENTLGTLLILPE